MAMVTVGNAGMRRKERRERKQSKLAYVVNSAVSNQREMIRMIEQKLSCRKFIGASDKYSIVRKLMCVDPQSSGMLTRSNFETQVQEGNVRPEQKKGATQ